MAQKFSPRISLRERNGSIRAGDHIEHFYATRGGHKIQLAYEIGASGDDARFVQVDVTDPVQMSRAADSVGPVDIVVNDADLFAPEPARSRGSGHAPAGPDRWHQQNVGALYSSSAFLPAMARNGGGSIVHISTVPPSADHGDGASTLESIASQWSGQWARHGVRLLPVALAAHESGERASERVLRLVTDSRG